jgi:hypothetical protein
VSAELRARPGAVADLPYESQESSRSLLNQIGHEQPIVGGYVARRPTYDAFYLPNLGQISTMQLWPRPDIVDTAASLPAAQCAYPMRHILVRRSAVTALQIAQLEEVLSTIAAGPLAPAGDDGETIWYELPPVSRPCAPFLYLGQGWYPLESDPTRSWRWMGPDANLWLVNPQERPIQAWVEFSAEAFGAPGTRRTISVSSGEARIASMRTDQQRRSYRILVTLPPGTSQIRLQAETTTDAQSGRALSLSVTRIRLGISSVAP